MTIKETAGKALLYFYQLQRTVPASMRYRQLGFLEKKDGGISFTCDKKWLRKDLLDINTSAIDIFNAYNFLIDKGFIRSVARASAGTTIYVGVIVSDTGIDIVEGIEGGDEGRRAFTSAFNIKVDTGADVESVIKSNLKVLLDDETTE